MAVRQGLIPVAAILLLATVDAIAQQSAIRRWTEGLKQVRTGQAGTTISEPIDAPGTYALLRREGAGYVIVDWSRNRLALPYRPGDEILGWDADRQQAFLAFHADVSATGVNRWACPRGKANDEPYTACTSRIVTSDKAGNLVGGLLTAGMATAAGSMRELDPAVVDEIARRVDFPAKAYAQQKAWALADLTPQSSLAEVNRVAIGYGNDLTPEERAFLKDMTARIKVATQQRDFETATTGAELSGFITRYEKDDPAGLVAQARAILPERLAQEERERAARLAEAEAQRKAEEAARRKEAARLQDFRARLTTGMQTHCGMAITIRDAVVEIQTMVGPYWLRRDQVFPPGARGCQFFNGVYQES